MPHKEVAKLSSEGLPVDVKYLAAQVEGHATVGPPHNASIALADVVALLILRVPPADCVLNLRVKRSIAAIQTSQQ